MYDDRLMWDTLEHHHGERSADWYWAVGVVAISLSILCIILGNILLAIFILVAATAAGVAFAHPAKLITVELTPRGIIVDNTMYDYHALESFWIDESAHPAHIILQSKKHFMPYVIVPVGHIDPDDVRAYLLLHLKEVEHHESVFHRALEYFGF